MTTLTELKANEKVGILTTITIVALTQDGEEFFNRVLGVDGAKAMVTVFQMLLSYWMWLKKPTYWQRHMSHERETAKRAIRMMMEQLITLWPRGTGNGWEKPKLHEQLHVPDDIERNGAVQNYHTGPTENHHIHHIKNKAKTTQHRRTVLDWQIGQRYFESNVIDQALRRMAPQHHQSHASLRPQRPEVCFQGAAADICIKHSVGHAQPNHVEVTWRNHQKYTLSPLVSSFLAETYDPGTHLVLYTEYVRSGNVFRAHPYYPNSKAPWYDWVMFRWVLDNPRDKQQQPEECLVGYGDNPTIQKKHVYAPGQLLGIVAEADHNGKPIDNTSIAIARACGFQARKDSIFTTRWKQEYVYTNGRRSKQLSIVGVDLNAVVRHCLVIPYSDASDEYIEVWSKELWADQFLDPAKIQGEKNPKSTTTTRQQRKRKSF